MKKNAVKRNFTRRVSAFVLCAAAVALFQIVSAPSAFATTSVDIANMLSDNFAVLGYAGVTNTGATTIGGLIGTYPSTSLTGSGTITVSGGSGSIHLGDSTASTALGYATNVFNDLKNTSLSTIAQTNTSTLNAAGNNTTAAFAYGSLEINGTLTLDFHGYTNANIVIQTASTLVADAGQSVLVANLGSGDNVFWIVGSSATLNTTSTLYGNIIAQASVSMLNGAKVGCGSVTALTASVTMIGNTISTGCTVTGGTGGTGGTVTPTPPTNPGTVPVPEPGVLPLLGAGLAGLVAVRQRLAR